MGADAELVTILAVMHLVMLGFGVVLFLPLLRADAGGWWRIEHDSDEDDDGGGGGGGNNRSAPRPPTTPGGGGLPLPDSVPARVRLRDDSKLADLLPKRGRRRDHEPQRVPSRERTGQMAGPPRAYG